MNYDNAKIICVDDTNKVYFLYESDGEYKLLDTNADILKALAHISVDNDVETLYFDNIEYVKAQYEIR